MSHRWLRGNTSRRYATTGTVVLIGGGVVLAGLALFLIRRLNMDYPLSDEELREIEAFDQYERERVGQKTFPPTE